MSPEAQAAALAGRLGAVLMGHPPEIQGAALADVLAIWLAGHIWKDETGKIDESVTRERRDELLIMHVSMARSMMAMEHQRIHNKREPGNG